MAVVWQISAVHLNNKETLVSGVILKKMPASGYNIAKVFKNFKWIVKSYFTKQFSYEKIYIKTKNTTKTTTTDSNGGFSVVFDYLLDEPVIISTEKEGRALKINQDYPVVFEDSNAGFNIISDIDDTIMHSYTSDFFKRISTILLKTPQKRKAIDVTKDIFGITLKYSPRVFYVSKSESNLFYLITNVIQQQGLPEGILFLTSYLKWNQLFKAKKGKNYKLENIRFIIENNPNKMFMLLGDDSQKDMEVYANVIEEFPERISLVFIRQTKAFRTKSQELKWKNLNSKGVPSVYFNSESDINEIKEIIKKQIS